MLSATLLLVFHLGLGAFIVHVTGLVIKEIKAPPVAIEAPAPEPDAAPACFLD